MNKDEQKKFYESLGNRIKDFRMARNFSQAGLASGADLTQGYISEIEAGKARFTVDAFVSICDTLEVSPDALLDKMGVHIAPNLATELYRMDAAAQERLYKTSKFLSSL